MHFRGYCLYVGLFISTSSVLGGCSASPNSEPIAETCGQALRTEQGLSLNGFWANGIWGNGFWANGTESNGFWANGIWANGIWANGFFSNGIESNGFFSNGIESNGFWANGIWLNGVTETGELQGLALRGLSLDEAAELSSSDDFSIAPEHLLALGLEQGVLYAGAPDGTLLTGRDLVGVVIPFFGAQDQLFWLRIGAAAPHPDAPNLTVYSLYTAAGDNPCGDAGAGCSYQGYGTRPARATTR